MALLFLSVQVNCFDSVVFRSARVLSDANDGVGRPPCVCYGRYSGGGEDLVLVRRLTEATGESASSAEWDFIRTATAMNSNAVVEHYCRRGDFTSHVCRQTFQDLVTGIAQATRRIHRRGFGTQVRNHVPKPGAQGSALYIQHLIDDNDLPAEHLPDYRNELFHPGITFWCRTQAFMTLQGVIVESLYRGFEMLNVAKVTRNYELTMLEWAKRLDFELGTPTNALRAHHLVAEWTLSPGPPFSRRIIHFY
ncbi:hypothetical protein GX48_03477 [Paracoccidioides brasiliensis]|nr:hypothetical protein GX48_03477 [Paracoccidioides brasiliensis]